MALSRLACFHLGVAAGMAAMAGQREFFETDERLRWLSPAGEPLERLAAVVDFELFRPQPDAALGRSRQAAADATGISVAREECPVCLAGIRPQHLAVAEDHFRS